MHTVSLSRISLSPLARALPIVALLALAGCSTNESSNYSQGPMLGAITPPASSEMTTADMNVASTPAPSQVVTTGVENLDISSFVDPAGFKALDDGSKSQASSAQYFALQFGRVGAARTWSSGSLGGQVTVGPYVKVNNRDCRDFTNIVNAGSKSYTKRGTACREDDGRWTVGAAAASAAPSAFPSAAPAAASGMGASG